jgi:hypothetical protein
VNSAPVSLRPHVDASRAGARHDAQTSIYHIDDEMPVKHHIYGVPAADAPVMHLRRSSARDLFGTFAKQR